MRLCKNNVFSFSKERSSVNFLKFSSVYCESFLKNPSTKQIECKFGNCKGYYLRLSREASLLYLFV